MKTLPDRAISYAIFTTIAWCLLFSLMKGWGEVHEWANVSWLIHYDFGFVKRGLLGSLLTLLLPASTTITPELLSTIGLPLFLTLLAALLLIAFRMIVLTNFSWLLFLFAAVFFTSPYLTMLANIRNYLDIPISLLGIASLFSALKQRYFTAALILSIGVFIHELVIVIFLPLFVLLLGLQHAFRTNTNQTSSPLFKIAPWLAIIFPLVFLAITIINQQTLDTGELRLQIENRIMSLLPMNKDRAELYSEMLTYSFFDYLKEESGLFLGRITDSYFVFTVGLFPVITLLVIWQISGSLRTGMRLILLLLAAGSCLAPLTLHLIAFDTNRIWVMPIFSAFLALWLVVETSQVKHVSAPYFPGLLLLCLWVVYWLIEPVIMFNAELMLYPSDFLRAAIIPVSFVCYYISRTLPKATVHPESPQSNTY